MKPAELVKCCINCDIKAQKELYDSFAPKMLSVCHRYAKSVNDAKDIFQEGFLKVFENLNQLKDTNSLEFWIRRIFVNEALRLYNNQKKWTLVEITSTLFAREDCHNVFDKMGTDELTSLIQKLPDKMRLAFNMYVIDGYSHQEIAEAMNISVGTSKSNLHDARKALQMELKLLEKEKLLG